MSHLGHVLPQARSVLAVCAQSFGLGAALGELTDQGRDRRRRFAWALPERVTRTLNAEFGTAFIGRANRELDLSIEVDRGHQYQAIACHASKSLDNPVLWRRLELQGDQEAFRCFDRLDGNCRRTDAPMISIESEDSAKCGRRDQPGTSNPFTSRGRPSRPSASSARRPVGPST